MRSPTGASAATRSTCPPTARPGSGSRGRATTRSSCPRRPGCTTWIGFSRKWLRSVRDDQLDDGRIANFSPDGRRIKHHLDDQFAMMTGSAGWGDAIVAVPWELYESYGDEQVLAENWPAMARWVEWALEQARTTRHHARVQASPEPEPFEQYLWDGTFHWGEWTEPRERDADGNRIDPIKHNPMAWFMADKGEVGTAYLFRSTSTLARVAALLGRTEEAARYAAARRARALGLAGGIPPPRRHHCHRHPGELRARPVVRARSRRAASGGRRPPRPSHPAGRHASRHRLPRHRRPPSGARRLRASGCRVRTPLPAHRAVVADHGRPRRDDDLGGLGGHRRARRRPRLAQPLQQGRRHPLPAHPHPGTPPGARLGRVGAPRDRARPRRRHHLGARHPREPAGHDLGRVAHRGRADAAHRRVPSGTVARVVLPDGTEHRIGPGALRGIRPCCPRPTSYRPPI